VLLSHVLLSLLAPLTIVLRRKPCVRCFTCIPLHKRDTQCYLQGANAAVHYSCTMQVLTAEGREEELAALREAVTAHKQEAAVRRAHSKDSTDFLLACMEDVKAKVVELERGDAAAEGDGERDEGVQDNSVTLLPGALWLAVLIAGCVDR
jgi:hypothetical protein